MASLDGSVAPPPLRGLRDSLSSLSASARIAAASVVALTLTLALLPANLDSTIVDRPTLFATFRVAACVGLLRTPPPFTFLT